MFNLSDNLTHLVQLVALLATMCVLIIFAPSVPPTVILAAFAPVISAILGAKVALAAAGSPAAVAQNTAALAANTAATQQNTQASQSPGLPGGSDAPASAAPVTNG